MKNPLNFTKKDFRALEKARLDGMTALNLWSNDYINTYVSAYMCGYTKAVEDARKAARQTA